MRAHGVSSEALRRLFLQLLPVCFRPLAGGILLKDPEQAAKGRHRRKEICSLLSSFLNFVLLY